MARGRKTFAPAVTMATEGLGCRVFDTALYGRLSVLDNGKVDGDSLESQIELMERYIADRPCFRYRKLYQDNGFTGTNFDRPGWDQLMQDVRTGKINCIIVKDLSRLGRNYIDAGEFLEKECPRLGVRFISINDGYDSLSLSSSEELTAALKNIINDYYAKDISQKVCSALAAKRGRGEYLCHYAPYGYKKDPANGSHLLIDPVTAPVVTQIFQWRAEGDGYGTIVRRLNARGIPSPGRYRYEQGIITNNNKMGERLLWNRHVLSDILRNPAYIGHVVQGKCRASLYQGIPLHNVPPSEWEITRHTHEPILSEELFDAVQQINEQRSADYRRSWGTCSNLPKETNPYRNKLVCADCGTQLKLYRSLARDRSKGYYSYICPTYEEHRELRCTKKSIRSHALDAAVLSALKAQMALFLDQTAVLNALERRNAQSVHQGKAVSQKAGIERQLERRTSLSVSLYEDWKSGILTREEYAFAKKKYDQEISTLRQQLNELDAALGYSRKSGRHNDRWAAIIERYQSAEQITKELVDTLITSIRLDSAGQISVCFSFDADLKLMDDEIKRLKKEGAA